MVITVKNYVNSITKQYNLGEIDSRLPYVVDQVPADNTTAFTAGQVLFFDYSTNVYKVVSAGATVTRVVVAIEDKATTATRVNVLVTGVVCVKTTTALVERDGMKVAATGQVAKWVSGTDAAGLQIPSEYMKIASKISEGIGKAVTNAGTSDPNNKVLIWLNPPHA